MIRFLFFSFVVILLNACGADQAKSQGDLSVPSSVRSVEREFAKCVKGVCVTITLSFPAYEGAGDIDKFLNAEIESFVKSALSWGDREADEYADYEEAAEDFIAVFEKAETDEFNGMDWFFTLEAIESFRSSDLISLRFSTYHFTGGAHPNGFQTLLNYDMKGEGTRIADNNLVLDELRLLELALAKFRAYHEVADGVSLEDDVRFFLDEGRFFLPQTMGYGDGVFLLIYNAYEIGPYVMGVTELEIPITELEGIVRQPVF